jgi:uncharacterized protein DUF6603
VDVLVSQLPPGPEVVALQQAAQRLNDAVENPTGLARQEWDQRVRVFEERRDALKGQLAKALLGSLPVGELQRQLAAAPWSRLEGFSARPQLGPLLLEVSCPPLVLRFPNDPAAPLQALAPQLPDRVGGRLDAGVVKGGGTLKMLPDGVAGTLGLTLTTFQVTALGSLRNAQGTPSFLAVLGVSFVPGIQLGFGFSLSRVGGLVGINRTVEVDALASRLRGGVLADVLFAANPRADSDRLLAALEEMFPPRAGRHLVGPTLRLSWLQVGGKALFDVDLGVIVELPGPARIVIAGSARAQLVGSPPLLQLRIDVLGVVDFSERTVAFDATLVDSGALGVFVITGDAAFRLRWGDRPYTVLTLGGFYPGFRPEPANLPALQRIALALRAPVPLLTLRAEGYFAVTSNTLQLGARIEASFNLGISAVGFLGLDVLIQFRPFHFTAAVHAGFRVEAGGFTFAGVALDGTIDGPGPIVISGRLTIETFLFDVSWHETFTLPGSGGEASAPPINLLEALKGELELARNLRALAGPDAGVATRPRPQDGEKALVAPLGQLVWSQRKAPLGVLIERLEGAPLGSPQGARFAGPAQRAERALFSPGSFTTLSSAEALNRPAFEELEAGAVLGWEAASAPYPGRAPQPEDMEVFWKLGSSTKPESVTDPGAFLLAPSHVLDLLGDRLQPAAVSSLAPQVVVTGAEPWTSIGDAFDSATAAHQAARCWGGVALAAADHDRPVDLAGF